MLVCIALPELDGKNYSSQPAKRKRFVSDIVERWGGCTELQAVGRWRDGDSTVVVEAMRLVRVWCSEPDKSVQHWWVMFADRVRKELNQDSVYLEFSDAKVVFV